MEKRQVRRKYWIKMSGQEKSESQDAKKIRLDLEF